VRHDASDQAAAGAAVLKAADLEAGWGGIVETVAKPSPLSCPPSFAPRQDDLVVIGDVITFFYDPQAQAASTAAERRLATLVAGRIHG